MRANELGCRNGWNADLWVPASTDGETPRAQPLSPIAGRAKAEVEPAEQNDLITSIVAAKTDNAALPEHRPTQPPPSRPAVEEDIIVKQGPSLSWSSSGPISAQPATELVQDPKAAILRARDQFRQRRRNEGRLADRQIVPPSAPLVASAREAQMVDEHDLVEPEPAPEAIDPRYENRPLMRPIAPTYEERRPVSPVSLREIDRPFPSMTDFPQDRDRFESVPVVESEWQDNTVESAQADTWIETRQIDTVPPEPYEVDELFVEDEIVTQVHVEPDYEEEEFSVHHRESILNRFLRQRRERQQTVEYDDFVNDEPIYEEQPRVAANRWPEAPPIAGESRYPAVEPRVSAPVQEPVYEQTYRLEAQEVAPPPPTRTNQSATDYRSSATIRQRPEPHRHVEPVAATDDDFILPPPLPAYEPVVDREQTTHPSARQRIEQTSPIRRPEPWREPAVGPIADEFGDQPLFASQPLPPVDDYEIDPPYRANATAAPAFRMERICQTCRDFRPAENGERGWCNNKWAFNHRRMVDADDLACRNSLGSWWTPKDDVWRRDGDISRHAQQTPRVDQWLFGSDANDNERRRSGS